MLKKPERPYEWQLSPRFQVNMVWEGILVGLLGGGVVTLYRISLNGAEGLLRSFLAVAGHDWHYIALWGLILFGLLVVVGKLMVLEPDTVGSGIPQVVAEVIGRVDMSWPRVMVMKFVEGTLCTLAGLSLGREGPSVQLGGMSGKAVSRFLKKGRGEERLLVTCGAASGMSAAFHAPLTGVMFAIEVIHKVFSAPLIISVMVSSVVADFFVSQVLGVAPVLSFKFIETLPHEDYWVLLLLGIIFGGLGALHNQGMFLAQDLYERIDKHLPYARLAVPFVCAGFVAFLAPDLLCGGDAIVRLLETFRERPMIFLVLLLLGKYLFTTVSFASGAPGGTLFPLVVMGALMGTIFGLVVCDVGGLGDVYLPNFLVLGIAGLFAGVIRAPVTAIVLVFELTGSFDALLSVSIVSIIAYVTANLCQVDPFYELQLAKLLGVTADDEVVTAQPGPKILRTHIVASGSYAEGKRVKDIPWPKNCLCVTLTRCGVEIVPKGATKIQALDKLVVIEDSNFEDDSEMRLRAICHGTVGYGGK